MDLHHNKCKTEGWYVLPLTLTYWEEGGKTCYTSQISLYHRALLKFGQTIFLESFVSLTVNVHNSDFLNSDSHEAIKLINVKEMA